jgi:serine/threonine-protein kinase HipA
MVFNVIMYNQDDHAKNFAFILNENEEWQVSPAYELTFKTGPGGQHQSSVAGYGSRVSREALLKAAKSADINEKSLNLIIEGVSDVVRTFVTTGKALGDAIPAAVIKTTDAQIQANLRAL